LIGGAIRRSIRPLSGPEQEGPGVERHKLRVQGGVAGRPLRRRAAAMARWRTASGLRAGIPQALAGEACA
jgi:hypothetical protein